jgi:beta-aspartyl-peptidase (threonine type)
MDAAIMNGDGLRAGAIAVVSGVRNPIDLARAVLDDGEHVLLVGAGALAFAREGGVPLVPPEHHVTEAARAALARELERRAAPAQAGSSGGGTVGAVAVDAEGHVAAATSTGGMIGKRPGRVGDSPLVGAGTYADDLAGAASATGHGEAIIQVALTKTAVDLVRQGLPAREAAARALASLGRIGGRAGLILVGRDGDSAAAFNTTSMAWASCP